MKATIVSASKTEILIMATDSDPAVVSDNSYTVVPGQVFYGYTFGDLHSRGAGRLPVPKVEA